MCNVQGKGSFREMIICRAHVAHGMTLSQKASPGAGSASLTWQAGSSRSHLIRCTHGDASALDSGPGNQCDYPTPGLHLSSASQQW